MATCDGRLDPNATKMKDCQQLLIAVKSTVERLLATQLPNVWKTYGGLKRLSQDVEQIFNDGLRASNGICDCWQFILGLRVLMPTLTPVLEKHRVTMEAQGKPLGAMWILQSLEAHTLSNHLKILLQDKHHLRTHYEEGAFLLQEKYVQAFLLCLQAIDQNDLVLLADLNPGLLAKPSRQTYQIHTRSSSLPLYQSSINQCATACPSANCPKVDCQCGYCRLCKKNGSCRKLRRTISGEPNLLTSKPNSEVHLSKKICVQDIKILRDCESERYCGKECSKGASSSLLVSDLNFLGNLSTMSNISNNNTDPNNKSCFHLSKQNEAALHGQFHPPNECNSNNENTLISVNENGNDIIKNIPNAKISNFNENYWQQNDCVKNHTDLVRLNIENCVKTSKITDSISETCNPSNSSSRKRFQSEPSSSHTLVHSNDFAFVNTDQFQESSKQCNNSFKCIQRIPCRSHSDSDINSMINTLSHCTDFTDGSHDINLRQSATTSSILRIDYRNDSFLTSSTSEGESHPSLHCELGNFITSKPNEKLSDDSLSVNTLQASSGAINDKWENECRNSTSKSSSLLTASDENAAENNKSVSHVLRKTHHRSCSDEIPYCIRDNRFNSVPDYLSMKNSKSLPIPRRRSLLEEGGKSILPVTQCFFPQPMEGQSLTSFLSSQDFHTCAELDKENHHFSISEALISAIEQIKWNEMMKTKAINASLEDDEEESDEEIQHLKQRIRIRRRERLQEKAEKTLNLLSDGRTDTTTSQSASPFSSPHSSLDYPDSTSSDSVNELVLSGDEAEASNQLVAMRNQSLSLSMASLYSDADIQRGSTAIPQMKSLVASSQGKNSSICDSLCSSNSAESVALSLLKKFSETQLPKASDLEWLVSEQEVPQRLLPLPTSWPVFPEESDQTTLRLRGNSEWAPPRAQVIFNIHPRPQQKVAMAKQNYRCAGCGMKTELGYIKRFRYCDYLGKYFCQCCHTNYRTYIPARILSKWDFSKYCVSDFSRKILETMFYDPLFDIGAVNQGLYRRCQSLDLTRNFRQQLYFLKNYINTCRSCEQIQANFKLFPSYVYTEIHTYSINDLLQVKHGQMNEKLKQLVIKAIGHINSCQFCQARGFICEFCNNEHDIIFPFQIQKVHHCEKCGACYHKNCYHNNSCPKCRRIDERRRKMSQDEDTEDSDSDA